MPKENDIANTGVNLEEWLGSDQPSRSDYFHATAKARKIASALQGGVASIGLVGPFGSGKSTVVSQLISQVNRGHPSDTKMLVVYHSCWGFRTSGAAIQNILESIVEELEPYVDTFREYALPTSYRKVFSGGDGWAVKLTGAVIEHGDPLDQFAAMSDFLSRINARIVLVVEDLDRVDSKSFEAQEIFALLQQVKLQPRFSFVLTGGPAPRTSIDFEKMCGRIEAMPRIGTEESIKIIQEVRGKCHAALVATPHAFIPEQKFVPWDLTANLWQLEKGAVSLQDAVVYVLSTPRALRHALHRTCSAWELLKGEISWDHLFVVSVLRVAAPDVLEFVHRNRGELQRLPRYVHAEDNLKAACLLLDTKWGLVEKGSTSDEEAILTLVEFLFPTTAAWSRRASAFWPDACQGCSSRRYFDRAYNEYLTPMDVADQYTASKYYELCANPGSDAYLKELLLSPPHFASWDALYDLMPSISEPVAFNIVRKAYNVSLEMYGSSAPGNAAGPLRSVIKKLRGRIRVTPDVSQSLQQLVAQTATCSPFQAVEIWSHWASPREVINPTDPERWWWALRDSLQATVLKGIPLDDLLPVGFDDYLLYGLISMNPQTGSHDCAFVGQWLWISPFVLREIKDGKANTIRAFCMLIRRTDGNPTEVRYRLEATVLDALFGAYIADVLNALRFSHLSLASKLQEIVLNVVSLIEEHQTQARALLNPDSEG